MITIGHVIHPGVVDSSSDLFVAQPVTFATMEIARKSARNAAVVEIMAVLHKDEEAMPLPPEFARVPALKRSITALVRFRKKRKLALIKDILDVAHERSQAEYFIYTNVDISLQPYFYETVAAIIEEGYDAFVINRRTISATYSSIADIPLMYAEAGEPHKGYDCFVFRRRLYSKFKLGTIHVGAAGIGRALLANMAAYAGKFREFRDEHLTFHIGDACAWRKEQFSDYSRKNWNEYLALFREIEADRGPFDPQIRSYLLDTGDNRFIPDFNRFNLQNGRCEPAVFQAISD